MLLAHREELVSELTSFYEFLVGLHIPEDRLKRPPPGGWPDINQQKLAYLNKDDDVIDVLKHIPYIDQGYSDHGYQVYELCICNDFVGDWFNRYAVKALNQGPDPEATEPDALQEEVDSCVATLARPGPDSDGHYIFYDTARHTLEIVDYMNEIGRGYGRERGVKDFFELLKDEFRQMLVYPDGFLEGTTLQRWDGGDDMDEFQTILRRNGWPSTNFQQVKCLKELRKAQDYI